MAGLSRLHTCMQPVQAINLAVVAVLALAGNDRSKVARFNIQTQHPVFHYQPKPLTKYQYESYYNQCFIISNHYVLSNKILREHILARPCHHSSIIRMCLC